MNMSAHTSMRLVHSNWAEKKSFRMIPVTIDCPFVEALFDPESKILVLVGKTVKESLHMIPKLDPNGDPVHLKVGQRPNGKTHLEERKLLPTFQEYYITDKEDMKATIEMLAVNADEFNYAQYMEESLVITPEKTPLVHTAE